MVLPGDAQLSRLGDKELKSSERGPADSTRTGRLEAWPVWAVPERERVGARRGQNCAGIPHAGAAQTGRLRSCGVAGDSGWAFGCPSTSTDNALCCTRAASGSQVTRPSCEPWGADNIPSGTKPCLWTREPGPAAV